MPLSWRIFQKLPLREIKSPFLLLTCIIFRETKFSSHWTLDHRKFLNHEKIFELQKKLLDINILIPFSDGSFFDSWIYANAFDTWIMRLSKLFDVWLTYKKKLLLMETYFQSKQILLCSYMHTTQVWVNPSEESFFNHAWNLNKPLESRNSHRKIYELTHNLPRHKMK